MCIPFITMVIVVAILAAILIAIDKNSETYVKFPGKGYVKVPSRKPPLPTAALPYTQRAFKNPDNWDVYREIAKVASESCGNIPDQDDADKCRKAFPVPILKNKIEV